VDRAITNGPHAGDSRRLHALVVDDRLPVCFGICKSSADTCCIRASSDTNWQHTAIPATSAVPHSGGVITVSRKRTMSDIGELCAV